MYDASYLYRIDTLNAVWASWAEVGSGPVRNLQVTDGTCRTRPGLPRSSRAA